MYIPAWQMLASNYRFQEENMMMKISKIALATTLAFAILSCGEERPDTSSDGVGQSCPISGCAEGQDCVTAAGPGGDTSTCEIKCDTDGDCPESWRCNLPPIVPDSIPDVCVEE
jgi:hypothetical protein